MERVLMREVPENGLSVDQEVHTSLSSCEIWCWALSWKDDIFAMRLSIWLVGLLAGDSDMEGCETDRIL